MIFVGSFLLDETGAIHRMNESGRAMLERNLVFMPNMERLQFRDPADARALENALAEAVRTGSAVFRVSASKPVPSALFRLRAGAAPHTLLAAGIRLDQVPQIDPHCLVELLHLRRGEAMVAGLLADGFDVASIALKSGITLETARTYLKRAMAATGTHSQAQLVAIVLRCAALSVPPRSDGRAPFR